MIRKMYATIRQYWLYRHQITILNFLKYWRSSQKKLSGYVKIELIHYNAPFYLRFSTSDFSIFRDFFLKDNYASTDVEALRIIDAGANIGASTVAFKKKYPDALIIAIEPDKHNCDMFQLNVNHLKGVSLLQGGLASEHGKFMAIKDISAAAYSYELEYAKNGLPSYNVNGIMKDNNWETVDIVKIDIEGGEKDVFSKNTEWISKTKVIILELHDHKMPGCSKSLIEALRPNNFNILFSGENLILANQDDVDK